MSRQIELRCVIQRNTTESDKYYPKISSAYITSTFPWSAPTASIEINTNVSTSTAGYMSPIRVDDIIRIQANVQYSTDETPIYQDIFEGRIMKIESRFGRDNITTLQCRGHSEELLYRIITADYSAAATTTGAMLSALMTYLSRITDAAPSLIDSAASSSIGNYNVDLDTKYMIDVVREFEALESYEYIFSVEPQYDSSDNLSAVYASWQPVPTTASDTVQIIEGTPRLISASFSDSIEQLIEDVTVYGDAVSGVSVDGSPSYGTRYHVEVDTTKATGALCTSMAAAIRARFGSSIVRGNAAILGDPNIKVGDLIKCKIPSMELNGASIDGNYRCTRVTHNINTSGWTTHVDLGELNISIYELLAGLMVKSRLTSANLI